jgi:hypothetical protein
MAAADRGFEGMGQTALNRVSIDCTSSSSRRRERQVAPTVFHACVDVIGRLCLIMFHMTLSVLSIFAAQTARAQRASRARGLLPCATCERRTLTI